MFDWSAIGPQTQVSVTEEQLAAEQKYLQGRAERVRAEMEEEQMAELISSDDEEDDSQDAQDAQDEQFDIVDKAECQDEKMGQARKSVGSVSAPVPQFVDMEFEPDVFAYEEEQTVLYDSESEESTDVWWDIFGNAEGEHDMKGQECGPSKSASVDVVSASVLQFVDVSVDQEERTESGYYDQPDVCYDIFANEGSSGMNEEEEGQSQSVESISAPLLQFVSRSPDNGKCGMEPDVCFDIFADDGGMNEMEKKEEGQRKSVGLISAQLPTFIINTLCEAMGETNATDMDKGKDDVSLIDQLLVVKDSFNQYKGRDRNISAQEYHNDKKDNVSYENINCVEVHVHLEEEQWIVDVPSKPNPSGGVGVGGQGGASKALLQSEVWSGGEKAVSPGQVDITTCGNGLGRGETPAPLACVHAKGVTPTAVVSRERSTGLKEMLGDHVTTIHEGNVFNLVGMGAKAKSADLYDVGGEEITTDQEDNVSKPGVPMVGGNARVNMSAEQLKHGGSAQRPITVLTATKSPDSAPVPVNGLCVGGEEMLSAPVPPQPPQIFRATTSQRDGYTVGGSTEDTPIVDETEVQAGCTEVLMTTQPGHIMVVNINGGGSNNTLPNQVLSHAVVSSVCSTGTCVSMTNGGHMTGYSTTHNGAQVTMVSNSVGGVWCVGHQEPRANDQVPRANDQVPRANDQVLAAKDQVPGAKEQELSAKDASQVPRAKYQVLPVHIVSETEMWTAGFLDRTQVRESAPVLLDADSGTRATAAQGQEGRTTAGWNEEQAERQASAAEVQVQAHPGEVSQQASPVRVDKWQESSAPVPRHVLKDLLCARYMSEPRISGQDRKERELLQAQDSGGGFSY